MGCYSIPAHVKEYIRRTGYPYAADDMAPFIARWGDMLTASGSFYDYEERVNGTPMKVHRRSIRPASRVANEWASLIMNDRTTIATEDTACNEWLDAYLERCNFRSLGQDLVKKAFALGTGAWALWVDTDAGKLYPRRYDARMVLPLSWDDDGVSECAFCTRASWRGRELDQLQLHVVDQSTGTYHIRTAWWDMDGERVVPDGVIEDFDTRSAEPCFAIVKPAIENTCVDLSPYGQSVYADAEDAMQGVDLCFDAIFNEVDLAKMRIFISDILVDYKDSDGRRQALPFGRDNTVFRKVMSNDDLVSTFAPAMRTESQISAYRMALRTMGDLCGLGLEYFDIDEHGGIKTATEVSSDNSALMRNIRKHENALACAIKRIVHASLHFAREFLGERLPPEGEVTVTFDDSIVTDTASEKAQDMAELNVAMNPWEYRMKWYGEDEETARANVPGAPETLRDDPFSE